jgi:Type II CAAX prenyl endopeptidase Rce1-like
MLVTTIGIALALYPVLYSLPLNWVRFLWGVRRGLAPMPPDVEEHAKSVDREVFLIMHGALLAAVVYLLRGSSISTDAVGLSSSDWKSALALGALCSLAPLGIGALVYRRLSPDERKEDHESSGPLAVWLGMILLSAFGQELWRAFCIVSLIGLNAPAWLAILITAAAYGALQLVRSTSRAIGSATYGCVAGFLFIKTGSLLAPLAMGLIAAGGHLYQVRYVRPRIPTNLAPFPCPYCTQTIEGMERPRTLQFACPKCGGRLKLAHALWLVMTSAIISANLTLFMLHANVLWWMWMIGPLLLVYGILSTLVIVAFLPDIAHVEADVGPFDYKLFRF